MFKVIRNIKINYVTEGSGQDIVLLHGWGQNIQMMEPLGKLFYDKYRVTIIDLPGFGLSDNPNFAYSVYDYVEVVHDLLLELGAKNPIMIGHSFGGRLAIIYASTYETKKVVLFGAPCIRKEYKSKKQDILKKLNKVKILSPIASLAKNFMGSEDYKNAKGIMREVFVKVVNEDLSNCAKRIECPCLLIWGTNDQAAPIEDARELDKLLKDSALIELPGSHYCYLENLTRVKGILDNFL